MYVIQTPLVGVNGLKSGPLFCYQVLKYFMFRQCYAAHLISDLG